MVRKCVHGILQIAKSGKKPAPLTVDYVMNYFPARWMDDNTEGIGWTKHNEAKLQKYIDLEIRMVKAFGIRALD